LADIANAMSMQETTKAKSGRRRRWEKARTTMTVEPEVRAIVSVLAKDEETVSETLRRVLGPRPAGQA
jgi:hypothetical protein